MSREDWGEDESEMGCGGGVIMSMIVASTVSMIIILCGGDCAGDRGGDCAEWRGGSSSEAGRRFVGATGGLSVCSTADFLVGERVFCPTSC